MGIEDRILEPKYLPCHTLGAALAEAGFRVFNFRVMFGMDQSAR